MDATVAKEKLQALWQHTVETVMGCEMQIEDALTEEYPWGWVFFFVPRYPDQCRQTYNRRAYAFHRGSGDSIPIGTKGLEDALRHLRSH